MCQKGRDVYYLFGLGVLLVTLAYASLGGAAEEKEPTKRGSKSVKIGAVLPLTGNLAFIGEAIRNGMEMSKNELNALKSKGRTIEILYEDSKGNAKDGLSSIQKLLDYDGVTFLVVNLTNVCLAARPILDRKPVLAFYLSTHPDVLDSSPNGFRIFISGVQESILLSDYARANGYQKFTILTVNDAYGKGTGEYLESLLEKSGVISGSEEYQLASPDFRAIATKIKDQSPDALVVIGYGREYPLLFRQLEAQGWTGKIMGNLSFANVAGQAVDSPLAARLSYTAPGFSSNATRLKSSETFIEKYKQKYGKEPDFNAAYGYDNVTLMADAMTNADNVAISQVRSNLLKVRAYEGAIGRIDMAITGDSETEMKVIEGIQAKVTKKRKTQ